MEKQIICTVCPRGCHMTVVGENDKVISVENYSCPRGLEYAKTEFVAPVRILTTLVKIDGRENELLPVRSNKPVLMAKIPQIMQAVKKAVAKLPVKRYDIIIKNVCDTGVDIVATKDVE
jgi:CxxC motif-containing protein